MEIKELVLNPILCCAVITSEGNPDRKCRKVATHTWDGKYVCTRCLIWRLQNENEELKRQLDSVRASSEKGGDSLPADSEYFYTNY